jgi:hypothetical protein
MRRRHPDDDTHAVVASMLVQSTLLGEMLENARPSTKDDASPRTPTCASCWVTPARSSSART